MHSLACERERVKCWIEARNNSHKTASSTHLLIIIKWIFRHKRWRCNESFHRLLEHVSETGGAEHSDIGRKINHLENGTWQQARRLFAELDEEVERALVVGAINHFANVLEILCQLVEVVEWLASIFDFRVAWKCRRKQPLIDHWRESHDVGRVHCVGNERKRREAIESLEKFCCRVQTLLACTTHVRHRAAFPSPLTSWSAVSDH